MSKRKDKENKEAKIELIIYTYDNIVYKRMIFSTLNKAKEVRNWYEERGFRCIIKDA